jgi:hypothetical protein
MTKTSPAMDLKEHKQFWEDRGEETLAPMSFVSLATFEQDDKQGFNSIRESHVRSDSVYVTLDTMVTALTRILGTKETFEKLGLNADDLVKNTVMTYIGQIVEKLPQDDESMLTLVEDNEDVRNLLDLHFASAERLLGGNEGGGSDE